MAHKLCGKVAHICCPAVHLSAEHRANASFGSGGTLVWAPRLCSRSARRGADSIVCCRSRGIASNTATSSRPASATASAACDWPRRCENVHVLTDPEISTLMVTMDLESNLGVCCSTGMPKASGCQ